ncbi:MAG: DUF2974 domain-containing protein [Lachnospiraceae bacterium]|nr:DUF2974 domain-containing protein [Lachnospiraceae bacterium]
MHDIFDYMEWRGDIPFSQVPPNDVDFAILCCLSYVPFDGVVPGEGSREPVTLKNAAERVMERSSDPGDGRTFHLRDDAKLLEMAVEAPRFSELKLTGYTNVFSEKEEEQFCAMTFIFPDGTPVVVFRGTDGTIIGWKEDFNMGFLEQLPSQKDAVDYLEKTAGEYGNGHDIYVCGHSKGGNLAMYAAAFSKTDIQKRIRAVRNFDGPGFKDNILQSTEFIAVKDRIMTLMPQSSMVGILLGHKEPYRVVHSTAQTRKQHELYTWAVYRSDFMEESRLSESSVVAGKAMSDWITQMSDEERMKLTDGIFEILKGTDAVTIDELKEGRNLLTLARSLGKLDPETRALLGQTGRILGESVWELGVKAKKGPGKEQDPVRETGKER